MELDPGAPRLLHLRGSTSTKNHLTEANHSIPYAVNTYWFTFTVSEIFLSPSLIEDDFNIMKFKSFDILEKI